MFQEHTNELYAIIKAMDEKINQSLNQQAQILQTLNSIKIELRGGRPADAGAGANAMDVIVSDEGLLVFSGEHHYQYQPLPTLRFQQHSTSI